MLNAQAASLEAYKRREMEVHAQNQLEILSGQVERQQARRNTIHAEMPAERTYPIASPAKRKTKAVQPFGGEVSAPTHRK